MCRVCLCSVYLIFFFNDTATTEIYTLSLHDALPISQVERGFAGLAALDVVAGDRADGDRIRIRRPTSASFGARSEEHTSELQSRLHLVCRLLLEKKKKGTWNEAAACFGRSTGRVRGY